ncbi:LacI family transcriptional regulator [Herbaspirillum frisingense]|uniref:LacI family DNA-binding transcriptional regulator n=1 Tax=Herbaspirillum frisingense TaxID=92645 RepID=UPI001601D3F7|nr:substrate-binding domain-containing protein [Herbaspirillum frisingense]QNB06704.1 LacI family transcriptional regulator [Herbaspirillum frisingense]
MAPSDDSLLIPRPVAEERARPTVRDVAQLAGVSIGTVSRVVNEIPNVSPSVRARVREAIGTLGWRPSMVAKNMRGQATRMIGFIFSDLENPLYASMIKGAEDVLTEAGYLLIVGSSNERPEQECSLIELFDQRQADGLIFTITDERHAQVLDSLTRARFPVVMLERDVEVPTAGAVTANHYEGTLAATRHLLDLGHRRIALVSGGRHNRVGRDRLRGFNDAHEERGLAPVASLLRIDDRIAEDAFGLRQTQMLLSLPEPPTAILALGRHLLRGVLSACRSRGVRIPQDLSLITTNDSDLAELVQPAVTVIRYSAYELGREAALLLLQRLARPDDWHFSSIEVPTELVLRQSCARL